MRALALLFAISIALGVLGCNDTTGPNRTQRAIYAIQVTASAAVTDTIHITFEGDSKACDSGVIVESQMMATGMRFSVSSVPSTGSCPSGVYIGSSYSYIVVPPHSVPFAVSFAEPGQADSIRVVGAP